MLKKLKEYFKDKKNRRNFIITLIFALTVAGVSFYKEMNKPEEVKQSVTKFYNFVHSKNVKGMKKVKVFDDNNKLQYTYKKKNYIVSYPRNYLTENTDILKTLAKNKIDVSTEKSSKDKLMIVFEVARMLLYGVIIYVFIKMISDSFASVELKEVENEKITFKDIAGYGYVKEELGEIVDFLKNPSDFEKYTDKIPKGVLLEGPPGNGKTLFAKAVAGETKTPFFQISASDIEDKYVGSGARRIEKIFKTVRKKAEESGKVILFIDEIDAVGMKRESRTVQETNQTINKLLTEMDGFEKDSKVIIIAATNLSSTLDSALTRSGRFDRIISIERPNMEEREHVISLYLDKKGELISPEVYKENYAYVMAQQTEGFSNADLDKLVNEASLIAKKKKIDKIDIKTLREAFTKIIAGPQTNKKMCEEDEKIVAYHEAGHAVAQIMTSPKGYKGVAYITITPHGQSLGHVSPVSEERLVKKSDLQNKVIVALAGRAVEDVILDGDYTVGAANDLKQANQYLSAFVAKYGMSDTNENLFFEILDEKNKLIQDEMKIVRERLYDETKKMIGKHFDIVEKIALHLLENTSIEQNELPEILKETSYEEKFEIE